jgi:hypothetical protein
MTDERLYRLSAFAMGLFRICGDRRNGMERNLPF